MVFADIPCILSSYTVVDRDGNKLHKFCKWDKYDDVPPDVAIRRIVSIKARNDEVIVEVE